jgi:hypothetical protein
VRARVNFICCEDFVNHAHGWFSLTQPRGAHTRKPIVSADRGEHTQIA